jgi:hypothetical protein
MGRVKNVSKKRNEKTLQSAPFMKMKLVPAGRKRVGGGERRSIVRDTGSKVSFNDQMEKHIRHADPIVTAMSQSLPYITGIPTSQRKKLGSATSVAMQNAHLDRYKKLEELRESAQYASPPIQPAAPPPQPSAVLPQAISQSTDDGNYTAGTTLQVANMPRKYGKKFHQVLAFLDNVPSAVGRSRSGELVLDGRALRGTNYDSAFRGLYVTTNVPAPGARELLMHLKRLGVPKTAFSSKFAHTVYGQGGTGRRMAVLRVY